MMNKIGLVKILFLLFTADYLESLLAPILINAYINLPLTFLTFSFIIYKSGSYSSPIFSFLLGLYVDIISDSPIGLNAMLFCFMLYLVNSYANTFRLFSYFQVCLFFSASSLFFIGFTNLFINIDNFSYLELFVSFIFITVMLVLLAIPRFSFLRIESSR